MATITGAAGGGNWSAGGSWVGGVAPGSGDDVLLIGTSGNVTVDGGAGACRSLNCTGYAGTLTIPAATTLTIGDGTTGLSNVGLLLVSGMTLTLGNAATAAITFNGSSATQQTITSGGKTLGNVTFANTGSYQLQDGLTNGATATVTLTKGTFDTNDKTCSWGSFSSSNSNTRTLTMGASAITLTGVSVAWSAATVTALTATANTATLTFTGVSGSPIRLDHNGNLNGASAVMNFAGIAQVSFGTTLANFTRTSTATKTDSLTVSSGFNCTGTCTLGGNTTQGVNRLLVQSATVGTQQTITCAAVVINGDVDFRDIAFGGSPTWTNTGSAYVGDCGGNGTLIGSKITVSATQTWSGTSGGNWSTNAWTSRVPLPQDDVVINAAFSASQTVTADMSRLGRSIDFTGATGSPTLSSSSGPSNFGSVTLVTGMTVSCNGWVFAGRGAYTITSNGVSFAGASVTFTAPGGTYTLADAFTNTNANGIQLSRSTTCNTNSQAVNVKRWRTDGTLIAGSSTFTLSGTGTVWDTEATATVSAALSAIIITDTSSTAKAFANTNGQTYGTLQYTPTGSGDLTITGNNTFAALDLECTAARTITLPASGTQTVTGTLTLRGASGQLLSVVSSSPGTATTIKYNTISNTNTSVSADVTLTATSFGAPRMALLGVC